MDRHTKTRYHSIQMSTWIRFVALLMFAFILLDVCTPESCDIRIPESNQSSVLAQSQQESGSSGCCQFEEDCFSCAHYAPGTQFVLHTVTASAFISPEFYSPTLAGDSFPPYHPPRA